MELSKTALRNKDIITDFTAADLDEQDAYFRFQCLDWEVRSYSCGMIYSNAMEALEDGSTVLDGKSCVSNWRQLYQFKDSFDADFAVMAFNGQYNGTGHDGEDVVSPDELVAVYDFCKFLEILDSEIETYKKQGWSLLDFMV